MKERLRGAVGISVKGEDAQYNQAVGSGDLENVNAIGPSKSVYVGKIDYEDTVGLSDYDFDYDGTIGLGKSEYVDTVGPSTLQYEETFVTEIEMDEAELDGKESMSPRQKAVAGI